MPKVMPIQHSFTGGELTPRLTARSDTELYKSGLKRLINAAPVSQGPCQNRKGTRYTLEAAGTSGRVFGFQRSFALAYVVIISDNGKIMVTDDASFILGPEIISNGEFDLGLTNWTIHQDLGSITAADGVATLTSAVPTTRGIVYMSQLCSTGSPGETHNIVVECPDNDSNTIELRVGTTINTSDLLLVSSGGTVLAGTFTPTGDFYVTLWKDDGVATSKRVARVSCKAVLPSTGFDQFNHPWTADLNLIHAKMPPGADCMYFTHPNFPPQKLSVNSSDVWSFAVVAFTAEPTHWNPLYPRDVEFFEGRSWWGGPGETINASKSASYEDLTTGTAAADGMEFNISKRGEVMWLQGLKNLLVGTRTGEHIITSESGVIVPGDIDVQQQSAYGSNHAQPVQLGNKAAYATNDGRKLQDIGYQWTAEQWLSEDLLYTAEHFTKSKIIDEILWAQSPEKYLGVKLNDGTMVFCLYDPNKQIVGWAEYQTDGLVLSIMGLELSGASFVFILVDRGAGMYLEVLGSESYLDSSNEEIHTTLTSAIHEAQHLADRTVGVKVDGHLHPDVTIDASGEATLDWGGYNIIYGLKYTSRIELLAQDIASQQGSLMSTEKRWNKVWFRLHGSVIPYVESRLSPDRSPSTLMNESEALFTGDKQVSTLGYGNGSLVITNDLPLPFELIGIFGEMEVNKV